MAMQLAYYRDQGRFDATYESSMTRLFLHGRTETVRPVTDASCAFVRTMADEKATPKDKLKALQVCVRVLACLRFRICGLLTCDGRCRG